MEIYESERKSMKINENLWNPMEMEMEQGSARENAPRSWRCRPPKTLQHELQRSCVEGFAPLAQGSC